MEHLLSVEQAREALGISEPTLYRLINASQIPVVKIGDRTLFRQQDVEDFIERSVRHRRGADEQPA